VLTGMVDVDAVVTDAERSERVSLCREVLTFFAGELGQDVAGVGQRPRESVELGDYERVTRAQAARASSSPGGHGWCR
jgi:hypothetical protein